MASNLHTWWGSKPSRNTPTLHQQMLPYLSNLPCYMHSKYYDLEISCIADVADLSDEFDHKEFKKAGWKTLVETITGEELEKPKYVTLSNWDAKQLTHAQVKYACVDAYYSYKLGKLLLCEN
ncbi:hypothetical protein JCGZ_11091 [Jatropha curcas]|uniref:3'-5' exonuclease domain-containing protein n=1 Tax=Jatropha curcas TaxID=180498 RepID=A0A067KE81_JATCU|nr:hypothetical protein JCGZ_11091 [Jatropha curcas]